MRIRFFVNTQNLSHHREQDHRRPPSLQLKESYARVDKGLKIYVEMRGVAIKNCPIEVTWPTTQECP